MKKSARAPAKTPGEPSAGHRSKVRAGLGTTTQLSQLVAKSPKLIAQRKLGQQINKSLVSQLQKKEESTPTKHPESNSAHRELTVLNAALALDEEEKKKLKK
jgi:hypothetical protein